MACNDTFDRSKRPASGSPFPHAREHDEAAALISDLEKLVNCGLVVAVREVGGVTRYGIASRQQDDQREQPNETVFASG